MPLRVWTDSTATIGICSRDGLGKLRHIDTKCLWLQHKVRSGKVEVRKVKGTENPADISTKHLTNSKVVEALLKLFGCEYRGGRPEGAPKLRPGEGTELGTKLNVVDQCYGRGLADDAGKVLYDGDESDGRMMQIGGHTFPAVVWDEDLVPEAWSYRQTCLPHQTGSSMNTLFPVAVAAEGAGDCDFEDGPCALERRGREVAGCKDVS